jgi:hypothetical protein
LILKLNKLFFLKNQLEVTLYTINSYFIAGEDIYFSLGNSSFNYKLKSDLSNFDKIILANTLIDIVIQNRFEFLEREH